MSKYIGILNTVKNNRGSEAIARGMIEIIKSKDSEAEIYIVSNDADIEQIPALPGSAGFIRKSTILKKNYMRGAIYIFLKRILKKEKTAASFRYKKLLKACQNSDVLICVGGDNYDAHYGMYNNLHELHSILRAECKAKMVMYDCSLGEEDISNAVIDDFDQFDEITVRECITKKNLKAVYRKDNISYYPDPAFTMRAEACRLPNGWEPGKMVGINLSVLVLESKYGGDKRIIFNAYKKLVKCVIDKGYIPVFVSHVMNGQDYIPLSSLYESCRDMGEMILLEEKYNAAQLKFIISNCSLYVGARTHSTIAAYSSCVPTLVVGYSVKSMGIAMDLFGEYENYVISVKNLKNENQLAEGFQWLYDNQKSIQDRLNNYIHQYIKKAYDSYDILKC